MANNRLWIVCDKCGDRLMIMKYYPTWFDDPDPKQWGWAWYLLREDYDEWPHQHTHGVTSFCGPTHFSLEFEDTDNE